MSEANWPIRVGGVYKNRKPENCSARVAAISGDLIHHIYVRKDGSESHPYRDVSAEIFRLCWMPEDQSPIPALVEALNAAYKALQTLDPDCCCHACGLVQSALALAKQSEVSA